MWKCIDKIIYDEKFINVSSRITIQTAFIQVCCFNFILNLLRMKNLHFKAIIDAFNTKAKEEALKTCSRLLQTTFSCLIIRNFDYFVSKNRLKF
jgi:hypothetical protein